MKKILAFVLALCMALSLCACGGSKAKEIDLDALAEELLASGAFTDLLSQPAAGVAARLYGFEDGDVVKAVLYTGTGATAEEIFLAEASDSASASALKAACEHRVETQKLAFENYAPGEVSKLDGAVLVTSGNVVIFVVAADAAAAQSVVDSHT